MRCQPADGLSPLRDVLHSSSRQGYRPNRAPLSVKLLTTARAQSSVTRSPVRTLPAASTTAYTPAQGDVAASLWSAKIRFHL
jgi:hypothetical protein